MSLIEFNSLVRDARLTNNHFSECAIIVSIIIGVC